jgi:hypothetical protein
MDPTLGPADVCAHCDERRAGAEGTIWCTECLQWYRAEYAKPATPAAHEADPAESAPSSRQPVIREGS